MQLVRNINIQAFFNIERKDKMKSKYRLNGDVVLGIILTIFGIIVLYPFYNALLVSLVPQHVYVKTPFMFFPKEISFDSYKFVFSNDALMGGVKVTVIVLIFGVLYNMLLTALTAYAMTKAIPGKKFIMYCIIFTMYFGGGLIPFYLLIKDLGLMNNIAAMILPTGFNAVYMIIIKSFFEDLPIELEESAKIDGANDLVVLFKIILPLSLPILATFSLYYSVERWNEWWNGMLFIRSIDKQPLQLVLRTIVQDASEFIDQASASQASNEVTIFADGIKMASIIATMMPVMCLFPFLQKYFVKGLTVGAVKS